MSSRNRAAEAGREPNEASDTLGQSEGPEAERGGAPDRSREPGAACRRLVLMRTRP